MIERSRQPAMPPPSAGRASRMAGTPLGAPGVPAGTASPSVITVVLTRPLVGHLHGIARQLTDGDFEALVLWCEVAHGSVSHLVSPGAEVAVLLDCLGRVAAQPGLARPVMLRDLAAGTGIPRETVRRKLERLATRGHLRREAGGWVIGPDRLSSLPTGL
jgi:IclR helix-turn-helix domain